MIVGATVEGGVRFYFYSFTLTCSSSLPCVGFVPVKVVSPSTLGDLDLLDHERSLELIHNREIRDVCPVKRLDL